ALRQMCRVITPSFNIKLAVVVGGRLAEPSPPQLIAANTTEHSATQEESRINSAAVYADFRLELHGACGMAAATKNALQENMNSYQSMVSVWIILFPSLIP
ncbi:MAG: hypothetical protein R3Y56_06605, partial [Akkermansia sp.]